jgi:hypothetical protein
MPRKLPRRPTTCPENCYIRSWNSLLTPAAGANTSTSKMIPICLECKRTFSRGTHLRRHQERLHNHSKPTISGVFEEYSVPQSPITNALCDADLEHLPAIKAHPERFDAFGEFLPRISSVGSWKFSYSFEEMRNITLGEMIQCKNPVSTLTFLSF